MRIIGVTAYTYDANFQFGSYTMSGGRKANGYPSIVVRLLTDDGIEGWSESAPLGSDYLPSTFTGEVAALKELAPHVLGLDPRSPAVVVQKMDSIMLSGNAAKAFIDFACWDIFGKSVGLPTYNLLGGVLCPSLPAFTVIGLGSPETGVKKALAEYERGVTALQLKIGDDPVKDAQRIRAIHKALPSNVVCFADANCGWNLEQALIYTRTLGQDICIPLE
jgi:L-alanine-DL-glutamate epimerase-like enolase superfamily enzyme